MSEVSQVLSSERLVGTIIDADDRALAIERIVEDGLPVAVNNLAVYAIIGDLAREGAGERLYQAKGRPAVKTVASIVTAEALSDLTDIRLCSPKVARVMSNPDMLRMLVGDVAFLRVPIRDDSLENIPGHIAQFTISRQVIDGKPTAFYQGYMSDAPTAFERFERELWDAGAQYPVISSLNATERPEITLRMDAQRFCERRGLDVVHGLGRQGRNPLSYGSYPIFEALPSGLRCVRYGNVSTDIMQRILAPMGAIDTTETPENGSHVRQLTYQDVPEIDQDNLHGIDARQAVLNQRLGFEIRNGLTA